MDLRTAYDHARAVTDPADRAAKLTTLLQDVDGLRVDILAARDDAARAMHARGAKGVEIERALGVSHGRVSQILRGIR